MSDKQPLVCLATCHLCGAIVDVIPAEGDGPYDTWNAASKFAIIALDQHRQQEHP